MSKREIVHFDLDTFFVSCERLINNKLIGKPIIIGGTSDRGVVASCSYEARYFGVRSAMPMKHALRLCPDAQIVRGDMELYSNKSKEVTQIIEEKAPAFEKASIDEFYLDISGMDKFFGSSMWTSELSDTIIKETGLPISYGLSTNKTVAKIATSEFKPNGKAEIPSPIVRDFLNPLSISKIPMLGKVTFKLLSRLGVRQIHTLADMPREVLIKLLGKNGASIHNKANGIDNTPIVSYRERKSISTEQTFERDTFDIKGIKSLLIKMTEKLCFQLRNEKRVTSVIAVKIRYNNFDTHNQQLKIPYTSADHIIMKKILELFDKLYERRMRIRLVGIRFSGLVSGSYQINLFEESVETIALYQAMDKLKNRFGKYTVQRASGFNALSRDNVS